VSLVDYAGMDDKKFDASKITPESWTLLLLARQNVEGIITMIGLENEVDFDSTLATGAQPLDRAGSAAETRELRRSEQDEGSGLLRRSNNAEDGRGSGRQLVLDRDEHSPVKPSRMRNPGERIQLPTGTSKPKSILSALREESNASSALDVPKRANSPVSRRGKLSFQ
jgi:hypothetical protein